MNSKCNVTADQKMDASAEIYCHNTARKQLTDISRQQLRQEQRLKRARLLYQREQGRKRRTEAQQNFTATIRGDSQVLNESLAQRRAVEERILLEKRLKIQAMKEEKRLIELQEQELLRARRECYEQAKEAEMHRWWKIQNQSGTEFNAKRERVLSLQREEAQAREHVQQAVRAKRDAVIGQREREARLYTTRASARSRLYQRQLSEETQLMQQIERLRTDIGSIEATQVVNGSSMFTNSKTFTSANADSECENATARSQNESPQGEQEMQQG